MLSLQILANGLVLGGLYACIAVGFSLVWGVLNVINILHGSFIVLGGYFAYYAYAKAGIHPFLSIVFAAPLFFALGYGLQRLFINRMIAAPVLLTLTLTFGLDLMLSNAMLSAFTADFKKLILDPPLGPTGQCLEAVFPAVPPARPSCVVAGGGTVVRCK